MGKLFCIMGKSASGKDTIFSRIMQERPELKTYLIYTTRPKREFEEEGVNYHYVSAEKLNSFEEEGKLIEKRIYNTIHGPWIYATVDDGQIDLDKYSYLVPATLESYEKLKSYFGVDKTVPIYIEVEDGIRLMRALKREMKEEVPKYKELCRRFLADAEDFSEDAITKAHISKRYNNLDFEACVAEILKDMR
ncbi:MAG: guanylate kinase [Eubacteriales bacterium]|nr:guanylate kinase [Eubacteriales bacterium]